LGVARAIDSDLLTRAFAYAADWHREDVRKGTNIPYISHLLAVTATVIEHGGTDKQAAAALLHDVVEDHGSDRLREIRRQFGPTVAKIVRACSDSVVPDPKRKKKWKSRKKRYIKDLRTAPKAALLVSCADKLHNARATVDDARREGPIVWERFNAGAAKQAWYYRELSTVFTSRLTKGPAAALARELAELVPELEAEAAKAG
jgi:(p)ppGpp synthase/HD superfamily hydrolase